MKNNATLPMLPGRLGDPGMSLGTDPRADQRLVEALTQFGLDQLPEPAPVSVQSSYEDCLAYFGEVEGHYAMMSEALHQELPELDVTQSIETIRGIDGNDIDLHIHRPANVENGAPCVIQLHGGGMVFLQASNINYVRWRAELAATGLTVIGVEFRNGAGELGNHPFPAGLNDCASAVRWVHSQKSALDTSDIVLTGDSGGGNLSIATALKANQEGWVDEIAGVYAMCPYISGTYASPPPELGSMIENNGYTVDIEMMGALAKTYDPKQKNTLNPLAWPYHADPKSLQGLPPHMISVNQLDPLRDEGLAYHRKLIEAGVSSVSRTVNGTCHGGDTISPAVMPDVYAATLRDVSGFANSLS